MKKQHFLKGLLRILTDFSAGFFAWHLAYWIRPWTDLIPNVHYPFEIEHLPPPDFFLVFSLLASLLLVVIFSVQHLYSYPAKYLTVSIFSKILWGVTLWVLSIVALYSLVLHAQIFSRIMLAHAALFTVVFASLFRGGLRVLFEKIFRGEKSVVLVGSPQKTSALKKSLEDSEYVHVLERNYSEYSAEHARISADEIFFFDEKMHHELFVQTKTFAASSGKVLHTLPENSLEFFGYSYFDVIRGYALISSYPYKENLWWAFFKRGFDIIFSALFLMLFSPVFLLLALLIKKDAGDWKAPVFYISERVGRNGRVFLMWKFRSMQVGADKQKEALEKDSHREGPLFKVKNDPRITPFGKFLRKSSLDEIPQFINVLFGSMSLIGPRPHLQNEVDQYTPLQKRVLAAKPGISGLAQVSGRSDLAFEDEIALDSYYVEHSSFFLDLKIFMKTPLVLLFGKGND